MKASPRSAAARLGVLFIALVGFVTVGCSDAYDATGPSDTASAGELCAPPETDCPSRVTLERAGSLAVSRLDYELRNEGAASEVTVEVYRDERPTLDLDGSTDTGTEDAGGDADAGDAGSSTDPALLVSQTYQLGEGDSMTDSIGREILSTRSQFELRVRCDDCSARLSYVLASEPLECRTEDDCGGGWLCDDRRGYCVECISNADCSEEQECSSETNRCTPEQTGGCNATTSEHSPLSAPVIALFTLLVLRARRRHRRRAGVVGAALIAAVVVLAPADASADPPRAGMHVDFGSRFLLGAMGEETDRGIGLNISQELRGRHIGGRVELGANYFLTHQPPPPLSRELQMYHVAVGPQFYLPVGPVELFAGGTYRRIGLMSNSLIRITGPETSHDALGANLGAQYRAAPFEVGLHAGYQALLGLESSMLTIDVSVGLASGSR
ncbi:MAG: MYXO-CTERM sorting domain-containing protein [Persicimonas sp.]